MPIKASSNDIVCLGDSITYGYAANGPITSYPTTLQSLTGRQVTNAGQGGDTTAGMRSRWDSTYKTQSYKVLCLLGGTNDLTTGVPTSTIEANLQYIWQDALARNIKVYALTITPLNSEPTQTNTVNNWIRTTAPSLGIYVVDINTLLADPSNPNNFNSIYNSGDSIHPDQAGANLIAQSVNSALSNTYPTATPTPFYTPSTHPTIQPTQTPLSTPINHQQFTNTQFIAIIGISSILLFIVVALIQVKHKPKRRRHR